MATLQAARILEALDKAKRVGRVEEPVTIDGCSLVLQNLSIEDYKTINSEIEGLEDTEYLYGFQSGHICRAIVEIGGHDLRDVDYVEDEVPSGRYLLSASMSKSLAEKFLGKIREAGGEGSIEPPGDGRTVRLERHEWIRSHFLPSWGKEAVAVAWRKFAEIVEVAEQKAKEGVHFRIPDESSEEKFRRLVGEVKELEEELPMDLVSKILDEGGYISKSSKEELEAAEERLRKVAVESAEPEKADPVGAPTETITTERKEAPSPDPREMMRNRQPLNRQAVAPPVPSPKDTPKSVQSAPVPEQLKRAAQQNSAALGRTAQIEALEAAADPDLVSPSPPAPQKLTREDEVPELSEKQRTVDGGAVARITDQPPRVGINPRFRRPPGT